MSIKFTKIRWKNFLSTGNAFTEIDLCSHATTLIVGENGSGKSTLLDALCFSLFGKAFRSINKPQLVSSINNKDCLVEIEFTVAKKDYWVRRGIKPNLFEIYCNNELIDQEADSKDYQAILEEDILGINYKSFTQIVILGSASFIPFMQLSASHRREIIEDILDIQVFSEMNSILKERVAETKEKIRTNESSISLIKEKGILQRDYIATLEKDKSQKEQLLKEEIQKLEQTISKAKTQLAEKKTQVDSLAEKLHDSDALSKERSTLVSNLNKLQNQIEKIEEELEFYTENDVCPSCSQNIQHDHKESVRQKHNTNKKQLDNSMKEIRKSLESVEEKMKHNAEVNKKIDKIKNDASEISQEIRSSTQYMNRLQKEIEESSGSTANIEEEKAKLKQYAKQVVALNEERALLKEEKQYQDICSVMLKDSGIKTRVIRQYLPVINKLINKYLTLMDFFVSFELDESFNETIKSRHRDTFSYSSFSEGEKQRINLALLFTWRAIARSKNSVATNLLILDEVFDSSLDANGTDFVMDLLNSQADANIFVISHKTDQLVDKFQSVLKFEKRNNFSKIANS